MQNIEVKKYTAAKSYLSNYCAPNEFVLIVGREMNDWKIALSGNRGIDLQLFDIMRESVKTLGKTSKFNDSEFEIMWGDENKIIEGYHFKNDPNCTHNDSYYIVDGKSTFNFDKISLYLSGLALDIDSIDPMGSVIRKAIELKSSPILYSDLFPLGSLTDFFLPAEKRKYYKSQQQIIDDNDEPLIAFLANKKILDKISLVIICGSAGRTDLMPRAKKMSSLIKESCKNALVCEDFPFLSSLYKNHTEYKERLKQDLRSRPEIFERFKLIMQSWGGVSSKSDSRSPITKSITNNVIQIESTKCGNIIQKPSLLQADYAEAEIPRGFSKSEEVSNRFRKEIETKKLERAILEIREMSELNSPRNANTTYVIKFCSVSANSRLVSIDESSFGEFWKKYIVETKSDDYRKSFYENEKSPIIRSPQKNYRNIFEEFTNQTARNMLCRAIFNIIYAGLDIVEAKIVINGKSHDFIGILLEKIESI